MLDPSSSSGRLPGERRIEGERRVEVGDCRQRLVAHEHRFGCVLGSCLGLRDDECDRLAGEDHLPLRERLVRSSRARRRRKVVRRQDGDDSLDRQGTLAVDVLDQRVRLRAEHEPRVEQANERIVGREPRLADDLLGRVDARARDADHVAHGESSEARARARSSARPATTPARWRR
jgi:hypothetical protein